MMFIIVPRLELVQILYEARSGVPHGAVDGQESQSKPEAPM